MKTAFFSGVTFCFLLLIFVLNAQSSQEKEIKVLKGGTYATQEWIEPKYYFEDIRVIETVSRRQLTVYEVMDMLDKLPNVKTVTISMDARRRFPAWKLAYPQYASDFQLTEKEWSDLQQYVRERLANTGYEAHKDVQSHWLKINSGKPPFGLQVQK